MLRVDQLVDILVTFNSCYGSDEKTIAYLRMLSQRYNDTLTITSEIGSWAAVCEFGEDNQDKMMKQQFIQLRDALLVKSISFHVPSSLDLLCDPEYLEFNKNKPLRYLVTCLGQITSSLPSRSWQEVVAASHYGDVLNSVDHDQADVCPQLPIAEFAKLLSEMSACYGSQNKMDHFYNKMSKLTEDNAFLGAIKTWRKICKYGANQQDPALKNQFILFYLALKNSSENDLESFTSPLSNVMHKMEGKSKSVNATRTCLYEIEDMMRKVNQFDRGVAHDEMRRLMDECRQKKKETSLTSTASAAAPPPPSSSLLSAAVAPPSVETLAPVESSINHSGQVRTSARLFRKEEAKKSSNNAQSSRDVKRFSQK